MTDVVISAVLRCWMLRHNDDDNDQLITGNTSIEVNKGNVHVHHHT